ncbi:RING-box protein 2 [Temnothorax longispinosus]|uniref:RING-box protein 2 n=1 Tax=Temnothorax longispinosus TaxID=300112 RepID=A0A4S2JQW8_9HYME|nr:RING-box protein 2 [Temnothorax longispinosus]
MGDSEQDPGDRIDGDNQKNDKMFTLKKWNAVAMWSWDVECDTCAICRVQVMGCEGIAFKR